MDVADRTVVVTGASRGLGAAVAARFGEAGARVVVSSRDRSRLDGTVERIEAAGGTAVAVEADVTDEAAMRRLVTEHAVGDAPVPISVLVANAGINPSETGETPLGEESYGAFDRAMATNVRGVFATIKEAVPDLAASGRVLVPSGSVAREVSEGMGAYAVSKAGAEAIARGFAADLDQAVGVVDPGLVATELTDGAGRPPEDVAEMFHWAACELDPGELDGDVVDLATWKRATR
jgi:3-oxoacyl-[acyl-carrier protein] reductase